MGFRIITTPQRSRARSRTISVIASAARQHQQSEVEPVSSDGLYDVSAVAGSGTSTPRGQMCPFIEFVAPNLSTSPLRVLRTGGRSQTLRQPCAHAQLGSLDLVP